MTIEIAPKAPAPHKSGGADAHHKSTNPSANTNAKVNEKASEKANAASDVDKAASHAAADGATGAGGFFALLSALVADPAQSAAESGGELLTQQVAGDAVAQGETAAQGAAGGDTPTNAGLADAAMVGINGNANAAANANAKNANANANANANVIANATGLNAVATPSVLLAQSAAASPTFAATTVPRSDPDPAPAALAAAMTGSGVGSTASKPAGFVGVAQLVAQLAPAQDGGSRLVQRLQGNSGGMGKGKGLADAADLQGMGTGSIQVNGLAGAGLTGVAATQAEPRPAFDFKMFAAMQEARGTQAVKAPEPLVQAGFSGIDRRMDERTEFAKSSAESLYGVAPVGTSSNGFSVSGSAEAAPAPDMQVAEQVKYWISQDVQNAELKLDGLGDQPVEVSISISGNEAHVAFRSDEIQTRDVLESAGAHLKDMLAREGLLLSGVSVGTSGANDGGGNERKPRQGMKQGLVNAAPVGAVETAKMARGTTGRALDLFV